MGKTSKIAVYRNRRSHEELVTRRLKLRRGATRYCCYGTCKSDSRNVDEPEMVGVSWIPFPKPHIVPEKCRKWIYACGRPDFVESNVKKWTYICSKHFVGGSGPTATHPDPVPAVYDARQVWLNVYVNVYLSYMYMHVCICMSLSKFNIYIGPRHLVYIMIKDSI